MSIENLPAGYGVKSIMTGATELRSGLLRLSTLTFSGAPNAASGPMTSTAVLIVTLTPAPPAPRATSGVRVAGWAPDARRRSIYLSGKPGFFYSDGTFEFRGVTPGRHLSRHRKPGIGSPARSIGYRGKPRLGRIELNEVAILPRDIQSADAPGAASSNAAGSALRLSALRLASSTRTAASPQVPEPFTCLARWAHR